MTDAPKSAEPHYHAIETEINENDSDQPRTHKFGTLYWVWEVVATIASAACIVAVIIILARMQEKPLDNWNITISLNATIAIFITAAKSLSLLVIGACIAQSKWIRFKTSARKLHEFDLFDSAARGPLGSLMLLFQIRWHSGLASVGAIVTILALGVDTFAQQVVRFETRDVEVMNGTASFGLSRNYTGGAKWKYPHPEDIEAKSVDVAMEGALLRGIYNIPADPDFSCSSRCVWKESYVSLGFSSNCHNVTTSTLASNPNTTMSQSIWNGQVMNNLTTPGNITFGMDFDSLYRTQIKIVATGFTARYGSNQTFPPDFVHVVVARRRPNLAQVGPDDEGDSPSSYFGELEIFECAIGFLAYEYSGLAATGTQLTVKSSPLKLEDGLKDGAHRRVLFNQPDLPAFQIEEADILAMTSFFKSSRFSGNMTTGQISKTLPSGVSMALANSDIAKTFDNMAASMTERLRSRNDEVARGMTIISIVFVRIRWAWLTLPICVTLIAALFLLATWLNTRLHRCIPWKSSAIALLYHQVIMEGETNAVLRSDLKTIEDMDYAAKKTKARTQ